METSEDAESQAVRPPPDKRPKRPHSVSPTKKLEQLMNLPGGCCMKRNQQLGPDCKAIQCDSWIHSRCEGVSDEVYENMSGVLGNLNNLVY